MIIPVYKPFLRGNYKRYTFSAINSSWISSRGSFIEKFENAFSEYLGPQVHSTTVANGTVALDLALRVLNVKPNDEVIIPNFNYIASANAVVRAGAKPVFVDCDSNTWNIDPAGIEEKITKKTKAIITVHVYGSPCQMDKIMKIAQDHELFVIEDAAEALGSTFNGQMVGTFGDIATFSFFGNKTITTGEGGMISSKNAELVKAAKHLKSQAVCSDKEYWHDEIGYNFRMTNIQAAIGLSQIEIIDDILSRKNDIYDWYRNALEGLPVIFQKKPSKSTSSRWMNSCKFKDEDTLKAVRNCLRENGIETRPAFPLLTDFTMYLESNENFPIGEEIARTGMCLPSYPGLKESEVLNIVSLITKEMS